MSLLLPFALATRDHPTIDTINLYFKPILLLPASSLNSQNPLLNLRHIFMPLDELHRATPSSLLDETLVLHQLRRDEGVKLLAELRQKLLQLAGKAVLIDARAGKASPTEGSLKSQRRRKEVRSPRKTSDGRESELEVRPAG